MKTSIVLLSAVFGVISAEYVGPQNGNGNGNAYGVPTDSITPPQPQGGPYPPSGWKPAGPRLLLPGEARGAQQPNGNGHGYGNSNGNGNGFGRPPPQYGPVNPAPSGPSIDNQYGPVGPAPPNQYIPGSGFGSGNGGNGNGNGNGHNGNGHNGNGHNGNGGNGHNGGNGGNGNGLNGGNAFGNGNGNGHNSNGGHNGNGNGNGFSGSDNGNGFTSTGNGFTSGGNGNGFTSTGNGNGGNGNGQNGNGNGTGNGNKNGNGGGVSNGFAPAFHGALPGVVHPFVQHSVPAVLAYRPGNGAAHGSIYPLYQVSISPTQAGTGVIDPSFFLLAGAYPSFQTPLDASALGGVQPNYVIAGSRQIASTQPAAAGENTGLIGHRFEPYYTLLANHQSQKLHFEGIKNGLSNLQLQYAIAQQTHGNLGVPVSVF